LEDGQKEEVVVIGIKDVSTKNVKVQKEFVALLEKLSQRN